jgi:hypothetical protein
MTTSFNRIISKTRKNVIADYDYTSIDQDATQDLIMSIAVLMDRVFETPNQNFETYVQQNRIDAEDDPAEMFDRMFAAVNPDFMTKYQKQFYDFACINTRSIFKWYRKNHNTVNLSPKQIEWYRRWFTKHTVGHACLYPSQDKVIVPVFTGVAP